MKVNLNKPHLCHVCKKQGKFFYKKWWCTYNKYLEGICNMIQGGFVTVDLAEKYIEIHNTKAETKDHVQK